jgi:hypothetical protein
MTEEVSVAAMNIALLKEIQVAIQTMNEDVKGVKSELEVIRNNQQKNTIHLKYEVDLSVIHTNEEIADFTKMGIEINALTVMPVPSAISIRMRGLTDAKIDLDEKEEINVTNHLITRLLVTNTTGSGTAEIHVFGKEVM